MRSWKRCFQVLQFCFSMETSLFGFYTDRVSQKDLNPGRGAGGRAVMRWTGKEQRERLGEDMQRTT